MSGAGADAQKKREWQAVIDEMTKLLSKKATERLIDKQLSEIFFDGRGLWLCCARAGGGGPRMPGRQIRGFLKPVPL